MVEFHNTHFAAAKPAFTPPKVGMIVWFYPSEMEGFAPNGVKPHAAIITHVHPNDHKFVNVNAFEMSGQPRPIGQVPHRSLVQNTDNLLEGQYPHATHWDYIP